MSGIVIPTQAKPEFLLTNCASAGFQCEEENWAKGLATLPHDSKSIPFDLCIMQFMGLEEPPGSQGYPGQQS
jgi:hypothetical protein